MYPHSNQSWLYTVKSARLCYAVNKYIEPNVYAAHQVSFSLIVERVNNKSTKTVQNIAHLRSAGKT
jgi:hypothetical protein